MFPAAVRRMTMVSGGLPLFVVGLPGGSEPPGLTPVNTPRFPAQTRG